MNNIKFDSDIYKQSRDYKEFILDNSELGYLSIRSYAANLAIPISGVKIIVSKIINNQNVIFYEGETNDLGMIDSISLPTPKINSDNEIIPKSINYEIQAIYNGSTLIYSIDMFSNIKVLQNISVVPSFRKDSIYGI